LKSVVKQVSLAEIKLALKYLCRLLILSYTSGFLIPEESSVPMEEGNEKADKSNEEEEMGLTIPLYQCPDAGSSDMGTGLRTSRSVSSLL